jgi:hypothetical protein
VLRRVLRRGRLLRGATLLPGAFVLSIRGVATGRIPVPLQVRTLTLASPSEGVVRRAFFRSSRTGPAATRIAVGSREAWAVFQFETQPARSPIVVTWFAPDGQVIGSSTKNSRPTIESVIGSGTGLRAGTYRAELSAGGRVVRRVNVPVG